MVPSSSIRQIVSTETSRRRAACDALIVARGLQGSKSWSGTRKPTPRLGVIEEPPDRAGCGSSAGSRRRSCWARAAARRYPPSLECGSRYTASDRPTACHQARRRIQGWRRLLRRVRASALAEPDLALVSRDFLLPESAGFRHALQRPPHAVGIAQG